MEHTIPRIRRKHSTQTKDQLTLQQQGELVYLTAHILATLPWVRHGFSTRLGGVSTGDVGTMNLSFAREENQENVRENYRRMAAALGIDPERLVLTRQTHSTHVKVAVEADAGAGFLYPRPYDEVDALVSDVPALPLVCFSADCVPLLFADPKHRAVGCAHSGWRGTVGDIAGAVVQAMQENYHTRPEQLLVAIGPSICQDCYEVGEDVITHFAEKYDVRLQDVLFYRKPNGKYQLNLWEACRQNLIRAGVAPEHISFPDVCTHCNPDLLFSHRSLHGRQGNLGAFICAT